MVAQFDPAAFKAQQRANWNAISVGWESWQDWFETAAFAVSERLVQLAGLRPGQTVLDVGSGIGEPALTAARVVGPNGRVVGVDLAPDMVARARRRADGTGNVEFIEGDVETLDLPGTAFDAVLSRWGLMFATDHVAAFRTLRRLLAPGGVLAAAVWGPASANALMHLGFQVLSRRLDLAPPPPGTPGPFSMSDPAHLTDELAAAGFVQISVAEFPMAFRLGSVKEYVAFTKAVTPPALLEMLRTRFSTDEDQQTWSGIAAAAEAYAVADGEVELPATALCLRAVTPADPGAAASRP